MTVASMGMGRYLGGLPDNPREMRGRIWANDDGVGLGEPVELLIPLSEIQQVDVETVQVAKSKVPATAAFGILGALAAKGSDDKVAVTVHLRSGTIAYFQLDDLALPFVQSMVRPWIVEHGFDETPAGSDLASQLERIAALHESGALSDSEFAAAKQRVLRV